MHLFYSRTNIVNINKTCIHHCGLKSTDSNKNAQWKIRSSDINRKDRNRIGNCLNLNFNSGMFLGRWNPIWKFNTETYYVSKSLWEMTFPEDWRLLSCDIEHITGSNMNLEGKKIFTQVTRKNKNSQRCSIKLKYYAIKCKESYHDTQ